MGARFCQHCGTALGTGPSSSASRKTVTVLFCDLVDSTGLGERLDPESLRLLLSRYFDEMEGAVGRHGGTVEKFVGDAVLAVFGVPQVHEDDALRAVRAADEMRSRLQRLNEGSERGGDVQLRIRVGINTGEVLATQGVARDHLVTGDTVNVAARLEQAAEPGQIVIGEDTYRLVRGAVEADRIYPLELKGKKDPVSAFRLQKVVEAPSQRSQRLVSPMVGRERALSMLKIAFDSTIQDRACHLVTVLGVAGVGKSRLVEEFVAQLDGADVYRAHCVPYGAGMTFFPLVQIVNQAAGMSDSVAPAVLSERLSELLGDDEYRGTIANSVAQLIGAAEGVGAEESFWACRRFLEALARRRPLVLLLDDIQWGGTTFLDLLENIADLSRDVPMLLVAMARPDLLDTRPRWGGGKRNALSISLEPLSFGDCENLIDNLLGSTGLDADVRRRIADAADGIPFFVEEILAKLIDDGLLTQVDSRWEPAGDLSNVPLPPTVTALLEARVDQLNAPQRLVLERAAIAGGQFFAGGVRALSRTADPEEIDLAVRSLLQMDLIRPVRSTLPGEEAYRFRHLLIRDAAYEAIPKQLRATLHESYASWVEQLSAHGVTQDPEIVGYHLEQALRHRADLGLDLDTQLADRAAGYLIAAGRQASMRLDLPASASLFDRAAAVLPRDDPAAIRARADEGVALSRLGESRRAEAIFAEVIDAAHRIGEVVIEARAQIDRLWARRDTEPSGWLDEMRAVVEPLIPLLKEHHDDLGVTKGLQLLAAGWQIEGRVREVEALLEEALGFARRARDRLEEAEIVAEFLFALPAGPTPVEDALRKMEELVPEIQGDLRFDGWALGARSELEAMRGEFDEARRLAAREEEIHQELRWGIFTAAYHGWFIESLAGRPDVAEREIRQRIDGLHTDEVMSRWAIDALLAYALCEQRRFSEARDLAARWADTNGDDRRSRVMWCTVRARTAADAGNMKDAEESAQEGVMIAALTDELNIRASSLVSLALVLRQTNDSARSSRAFLEGLALYEQKGNVAAAQQARTWWGASNGPVR
jgi:class 3 adenylate cyclase